MGSSDQKIILISKNDLAIQIEGIVVSEIGWKASRRVRKGLYDEYWGQW